MTAPALRLTGVGKLFGEFRALDAVDMTVTAGTIHSILGENGAGKTTLMNILYGLYEPEEGQVEVFGKPVSIPSPRAALDHGIGMIHQHFMLVDTLSVVENIILGLPGQGLRLSLHAHAEKIGALSRHYGFDINLHAPVWTLPMGMRQRVEILKALYREAQIIIFDEPTSILAPQEVDGLLQGLRRLRQEGKTVILITHKLEEVVAVADRITVMRSGRVVAEQPVAGLEKSDMARLMVGRDVALSSYDVERPEPGEVVLDARHLEATNSHGVAALKSVSFQIRAGEIFGIAGVDGNGQSELAEVLTGMRRPDGGTLKLKGTDLLPLTVDQRRHDAKMSYIPEDRHHTGLVLDLPVWQNAALRDFRRSPFSWKGWLRPRRLREIAADWVKRYDVRLRGLDQAVRFLSGGNQQKLIFAREIEAGPTVMVVMQPTKGVDVGAIELIQRTILKARAQGVAILYISTELEHILAVADRVAVICGGQFTGILPRSEATLERVGSLMTGISETPEAA
ncbi:ABC transporter ATP-binding protein [Rhizobium sp. SGZ-381]|uniref:ABC transporter ATP-binding protein n=1 Tax=Rhizobium sp. SGZ-381 TaxID=3342800 RepID=UPI00366FAD1B